MFQLWCWYISHRDWNDNYMFFMLLRKIPDRNWNEHLCNVQCWLIPDRDWDYYQLPTVYHRLIPDRHRNNH